MSYVANVRPNNGKFDPGAEKCILLGFSPGQKAYRLYSLDSKAIIVSRDVSFHDQNFPYRNNHKEPDLVSPILPIPNDLNSDEMHIVTDPTEDEPTMNEHHQINENEQHEDVAQPHDIQQHTRQSMRDRRPPRWLDDFIVNSCYTEEQCTSPTLPKKSCTTVTYNIKTFPYISSSNLRPEYVNFLTNLSSGHEPRSYTQDRNDSNWVDAMSQEIEALERNGTWVIAELPPGKLAIGCKWVFKIKRHVDGSVDRYKARLVAKGFHQIDCIDC